MRGDSVGEQAREGVGGKYKTRSTSAMPLIAVPFSNEPLLISCVYCVEEEVGRWRSRRKKRTGTKGVAL